MSHQTTCAHGSLLLDQTIGVVHEGVVNAARCGAWSCQHCGPVKAKRLRLRLMKRINEIWDQEREWLRSRGMDPALAWRPFKLLTLTMDIRRLIPSDRYAANEWKALPKEAADARGKLMVAWNRLHSWFGWKRRQQPTSLLAPWEGKGKHIPFFWVVEFTEHGWPHLHVLLLWRDPISDDDLQRIRSLWLKYGIGRIVDLQNNDWTAGKDTYTGSDVCGAPNPLGLAAYLTKCLVAKGHRENSRRWSSSKGLLSRTPLPRWEGQAAYSPEHVEHHRRERLRAGASIHNTANGFTWTSFSPSARLSAIPAGDLDFPATHASADYSANNHQQSSVVQ